MKSLTIINSLLLISVIILLYFGQCSEKPTPDTRVDSIKAEIHKRDSIIIDRDTVIYRVKEVRELVTEVRTETDTVLKLIACDSLAVACDSLAVQYSRQDSIFRAQIGS